MLTFTNFNDLVLGKKQWLNRFKSVAVIIAIIIAKCKHAKSRPDDDFACLLETQMSVPGLFYTLIEDTNQWGLHCKYVQWNYSEDTCKNCKTELQWFTVVTGCSNSIWAKLNTY